MSAPHYHRWRREYTHDYVEQGELKRVFVYRCRGCKDTRQVHIPDDKPLY